MLSVGNTIILENKYSETQEKFKSKILELKEDKIYIDYPVNQKTGKTGFFMEGTEFKASFVAKDSNVYLFDTRLVGRVREGNLPMVVISYPGKEQLHKVQRREFVRIDTELDVAIHAVRSEFPAFTTVTSDISAGGAAIVLPPNHRVRGNMEVMAWFVLPLSSGEYNYIKLKCEIIRIISREGKKDIAPLQFIDLTETQRQNIIKLCFDRQLEQKKRGMM